MTSRAWIYILLALIAGCGFAIIGGVVAADTPGTEESDVTVSVGDAEFDEEGETATVAIDVTGAENGVAAYDFTLSVDTDVVTIEGFTETHAGGFSDSRIEDGGETLVLSAALADDTIDGPDATIAMVDLEATGSGISELELSAMAADDPVIIDEENAAYAHTFEPGTATVSDDEPPGDVTAAFDVSPAGPEVDEDVTFDASESEADNGIAEYRWAFGDETESTGEIVTHSFDAADEYTVSLTVEDTDGNEDTTSQLLTVQNESTAGVDADFEFEPAEPTAGELVEFDASTTTGDIVEYRWEFGDGSEDAGPATTAHIYTEPGEYEVTLTVEDEAGATDETTRQLSISESEPPLAATLAVETEQAEVGEQFNFTGADSTGNIVEYRFEFGDGTTVETIDAETTHSFDEVGEYEVTLTVENDEGETDQSTLTVTVVEPDELLAELSVSLDELEVGQQVSLDAGESTGKITEYRWDITGDGEVDETTADPVVTHSYDEPGEYEVTVTVIDELGQTDFASETLTVTATPPGAGLSVSPEEITVDEELTVDAAGSEGEIVEYQFEFGDGVSETTANPVVTHSYDQSGEYEVTVTVIDEFGQEATTTAAVTVVTPPPEAILSVDPTDAELGAEIVLDATPSEGDIVEYRFEFGDGTTDITGDGAVTHSYEQAGSYTVTVTVIDEDGREDTSTQEIQVTETGTGDDADDGDNAVDDPDDTDDEEDAMDDPDDTDDEENAVDGPDDVDDEGPGFGPLVALVAFASALYLTTRPYRNSAN